MKLLSGTHRIPKLNTTASFKKWLKSYKMVHSWRLSLFSHLRSESSKISWDVSCGFGAHAITFQRAVEGTEASCFFIIQCIWLILTSSKSNILFTKICCCCPQMYFIYIYMPHWVLDIPVNCIYLKKLNFNLTCCDLHFKKLWRLML